MPKLASIRDLERLRKEIATKRNDKRPKVAVCAGTGCLGLGAREHVRRVMRYSGPRMMYRHPVLALRHMMD